MSQVIRRERLHRKKREEPNARLMPRTTCVRRDIHELNRSGQIEDFKNEVRKKANSEQSD